MRINDSLGQNSSNIASSISNLDALFPNNHKNQLDKQNRNDRHSSQHSRFLSSNNNPQSRNNTNSNLINQSRASSRGGMMKEFHRQSSITHREKQATKRDQELAKLAKPNCCFRFVVKYPWVVILIVSLLCLLSVGVIAGYNLFQPLGGTGTMFFVFHDQKVARFQEMILARQQSRSSLYGENPDPNTGVLRDFQTILIYVSDSQDKSLMEPQILSKIVQFENSLRKDSQFLKFCPVKSPTQPCDFEQMLMFSSFLQTIDFTHPEPIVKATIDQIKNNDPTSTMRLLFHKDVADSTTISSQNVQSIRSLLKFAGPVEGFSNVRDNLDEQIKVFLVFLQHILDKAILYQSDFTILVNNEHFVNDQILSAVQKDLIWIVLSFVLVLIYNTIHMKSLFLGVTGMVQTMMGFPFTYLIYKFVFFIDEFFHLQFIAFFLILGIAADDFFVFYDQWIQASKLQIIRKQQDKNMRLLLRFTITWKHSSWSMLVTSLTSALAFYVIVYSTVIPLKSLGMFTGTLILINYVLSITTFPALVLLNEKLTFWSKCRKKCKKSRACCKKKSRHNPNSVSIHNLKTKVNIQIVPEQSGVNPPKKQSLQKSFDFLNNSNLQNNFESPIPISTATKFQKSPPINGTPSFNKINLLSTNQSPQSKKQKGAVQSSASKYTSNDDDIRSCQLKIQGNPQDQSLFSQEDFALQVQVDKLGCIEKFFYGKFNTCVRCWRVPIIIIGLAWLGFATYLSYLMTPIKEMEIWLSQDHRVSLAIDQTLNNFPPTRGDSVLLGTLYWGVEKVDRSKIGYFEVTKDPDLVWDNDFKLSSPEEQQFFLEISIQLRQLAGPNNYFLTEITQPRDGLNIYNFMEGFSQFVQLRGLQFPVPQSDYYNLMKEYTQSQASKIYKAEPNYGFLNDSNPKQIYAEIQVVTSIKNDTPFQQLNESIDKWKEICADFNNQAIQRNLPGLSNCHFNGGQPAAWKSTQQVLFLDSAIGMGMVVIISFIVMILTNRNIIIAMMALIGVALIVISDIATMKLNNWTFGIAQSLSSVIFVGFSVDYVLHLSNYYINALSPSRKYRMQEAYGNIGGSIIGGAITTLVSAMSLLTAQFQLYYKFAFLISSTIIFSLLSSLFFFGALAHSCGPNNMFGDVVVILRYIFCCKCCKKFEGSPGIGGFRVELRRIKPDIGNIDGFMDYQPDVQEQNNDNDQIKKRNESFAGLKSDIDQINAGRLWNEINRMDEDEEQQNYNKHQQQKKDFQSKNKTTR